MSLQGPSYTVTQIFVTRQPRPEKLIQYLRWKFKLTEHWEFKKFWKYYISFTCLRYSFKLIFWRWIINVWTLVPMYDSLLKAALLKNVLYGYLGEGMMWSIILMQSRDNRLLWPPSLCNCHSTQPSLILNAPATVITTQLRLLQSSYINILFIHHIWLWGFDFLKPGHFLIIFYQYLLWFPLKYHLGIVLDHSYFFLSKYPFPKSKSLF